MKFPTQDWPLYSLIFVSYLMQLCPINFVPWHTSYILYTAQYEHVLNLELQLKNALWTLSHFFTNLAYTPTKDKNTQPSNLVLSFLRLLRPSKGDFFLSKIENLGLKFCFTKKKDQFLHEQIENYHFSPPHNYRGFCSVFSLLNGAICGWTRQLHYMLDYGN